MLSEGRVLRRLMLRRVMLRRVVLRRVVLRRVVLRCRRLLGLLGDMMGDLLRLRRLGLQQGQ